MTAAAAPFQVVVEAEEEVYHYTPFNNGAGPMWCHGCTCLVRHGEQVFASGMENVPGAKPLHCACWSLYAREADGWKLIHRDAVDRTREPSPLGRFNDGRLFLSVNPTRAAFDSYGGPAEPQILEFDAAAPAAGWRTLHPGWAGQPAFTEHSYRSFVVDGERRELALFQNIGYTHAEWAFRDAAGQWTANGQLAWPWGAEYDVPQPLRVCYPAVALANRALHWCGVGDIEEPYRRWRDAKFALTGQHWDYDFRRLFYVCSPDLTTGKFSEWVEIASRDQTCGWIMPCDLHVAPDGAVHLLWTERALDERLRAQFYPEAKQSHSLNYALLRDGRVLRRQALVTVAEGEVAPRPSQARFQPTPDGRLFVIYALTAAPGTATGPANHACEVLADTLSAAVPVPLQHPLPSFFTATPRAGSAPAWVADLLGDDQGVMRYVRLRFAPRP